MSHRDRSAEKARPKSTPKASGFRIFLQTISGVSAPVRGKGKSAAHTPITELFSKVDPAIDGEDCDHDCNSCAVSLPRNFKVDEEDDLYGHVKGWSTHILVATGKSDWVKNVADEKGSVMEAIDKKATVKLTNGKLMLSASNIPTPTHSSSYSKPTTVLLLPAFVVVENVTAKNVNTLISEFINKATTNTTPLGKISIPASLPDTYTALPTAEQMASRPSPHRALILLCSQKTRDTRCGQSAPLLRKELGRHLRVLGLARDLDDERPGGVGIYFISHVGGHKYSANVMVYRRADAFGIDKVARGKTDEDILPAPFTSADVEDHAQEGAAQCIWLARVKPEDCEGIVKFTVLQGKVVKPEIQLRGGFDRGRGVYSW